MLDSRKLWVVARFELLEAVRSRLFLVAMVLYGAGAALGSYVFLKALGAAETTARQALAANLGVPEATLAPNLIREKALPMFASLIEDESIRQEVLRMPPLSIFYGYMALNFVAVLVLVVSSGTMAQDIATGAARYILFRCDRLTWAVGKLLGQQAVLAVGLVSSGCNSTSGLSLPPGSGFCVFRFELGSTLTRTLGYSPAFRLSRVRPSKRGQRRCLRGLALRSCKALHPQNSSTNASRSCITWL